MRTYVVAAAALGIVSRASAITYDLVADFSDAANPNGSWAYREGTHALPHQDLWDPAHAQPAWARAQIGQVGHIPTVLKAVYSDYDWKAGDVLVHCWDPTNGDGNSFANIAWTARSAGTIDIAGSAWLPKNIGRGVDVSLWLNKDSLFSVTLFDGDPYDRAHRKAFTGDLKGRAVSKGDVVMVRVDYNPGYVNGDFAGLRMQINFTPTCEPDLDGNGVLDLFDFLTFVNLFNAGDPAADFNADSAFDLFDFLAFVNAFNAGC